MSSYRSGALRLATGLALLALATACTTGPGARQMAAMMDAEAGAPGDYVIGPGDVLQIFVWQHPDVSVTIPVRPDGRISTPLVEDLPAIGKTPTQLARDIEVALQEYIRSPTVSVIVSNFVGTFDNQVRVVGLAAQPQAIPFREGMTMLDVMIQVGGLAPNAAGNRARVVRQVGGESREIPVRLQRLLTNGDMGENLQMMPGDILVIPESRL
ncbi:MAG: polysaccharide export protein [Chromatiales bacterium]|nr:polysaccharide export protein [Chromatiales bacterium]